MSADSSTVDFSVVCLFIQRPIAPFLCLRADQLANKYTIVVK